MISFWYSIPAIAAILSGACIFTFCRQIKRFQIFMGFTLVFEGLFIMLGGIISGKLTSFQTPIYLLYICMMLLSPFFYWFATKYLTRKDGIEKKDFWMLEVVAVFCIIHMSVTGNVTPAEKNTFQGILNGTRPLSAGLSSGTAVLIGLDNMAFLLFLLEQLFVQIFCFISLSAYKKTLSDYYSNTEGKSLGLIYLLFAIVAIRFFIFIGTSFLPEVSSSTIYHVVQSVVFSLFYIVVALFTCRIKYTAEELGEMITSQNARQATAPAPVANEIIKERIDTLIGEKFYLDPDMDLMKVASKVRVNYKYISDYLHLAYNETFMVFVNRLRIEHSIILLNDKNLSMPDIAEQSGFISESTFYRNFIKVTGVTPSKYRKNS